MTNDRNVVQQSDDPSAGREETSRAGDGLTATAFGLTDVGCVRSTNQDTLGNRVGYYTPQTASLGLLYAVADGMGGHARGEVASAMAIEQLFAHYYHADPHEDAAQTLVRVMMETNVAVFQAGRDHGGASMGTTLTLALLRDNTLYAGNIGDSRTYRIRDGQIEQLTHDHSLIGEQVRSGLLTEEQARQSSIRNVITRAVGYREQVEPDVFTFPIAPNDILLLCSDGLHGLADRQELAQAFSGQSLGTAVSSLIELARQRGGGDNITALAVRVDQAGNAETALGDATTQPFTRSLDDAVTKPFIRTDEGADPTKQPPADQAQANAAPSRTATPPAPPPPGPPPAAARIPPPRSQPASRLPIVLLIALPLLLVAVVAAAFVAIMGGTSADEPTVTAVSVASAPVETPTSISIQTGPSASAIAAAIVPTAQVAASATVRTAPSNGPAIPTPAPVETPATQVASAVPSVPIIATTPTLGSGIPSISLISGQVQLKAPPSAQKAQKLAVEWEVAIYLVAGFPPGSVDKPTAALFTTAAPTWSGTLKANGTLLAYEVKGSWPLANSQADVIIILRNKADPKTVLIPELVEQRRVVITKNEPKADHLLVFAEPPE